MSRATSPPRGGLARYVVAAALARSADAGGVVAVVLIVSSDGGPAWVGGLLGACITAPHLLGPFVARPLDTAADGRKVIALAALVHGATLAAAVLAYPHTPAAVPALLLIASGLVGPFLTGGISSRLPAIAGTTRHGQRRAQGWDVATYGLSGTLGPTIVALISAGSSPTVAALVLAAATFAAAGLVFLLPFAPPAAHGAQVPRPLRTLRIMLASGRLRRTLYLTIVVAWAVAVLPITAVHSTTELGAAAAAAGALTAAYGAGNLAGSAGMMLRPARGEADRLMTLLALTVAVALALALVAPNLWAAVLCYAAVGVANAYFFAATLAARTEYSPPQARGQIFVWIGALKITAGSAGTASAGAIIGVWAHLPLVLATAFTLLAALVSQLDRLAHRPAASGEKHGTPAEPDHGHRP
ncbi:MFS family permease [Spinactinospora alkalitolerans]|uniref:MFS family permease n=1 Tax=Spinactinospora alkalitolerans TaxID=687207 RepID=A0A852TZU7_9ACTN|nr:MFS transporter [Spinactinospora alkalitolerans]NYE47484.1 MFS family permease [Spinactinospora alkalitolerans]